ncbi:MAG: hypothetical protein KDB35_18885 [Acidimicrobiales bacterium]|nr:hypothetical protein [Acidimicrobiales bacterium]
MSTGHRRPWLALGALVVSLGLVSLACGSGEDASSSSVSSSGATSPTDGGSGSGDAAPPAPEAVQHLDIEAADYQFAFDPPAEQVVAGWTSLTLRNVGDEAHQVMFARIKDGVDMAELAAAGAGDSSGAGAIEFVDMIGGVSYIGPGQDTTALVNLTEGVVMAMCYVPDSKGVAHALMGMTAMLTVGAPSGDTAPPGDEPVVGTIEFSEDGYRVPDDLTTGWYHVQNTDSALHEMALLRLDRSIDDEEAATIVGQLAANEVPDVELTAVGGMGAVSSGFDGYLYLDLDDGAYLAVDFMPDPGEPRPHMLDGYYTTFST